MNFFFLVKNRRATGVFLGIVFLILFLIGALVWPHSFFRSYWFGLMFLTQISIGALIVLLLQFLTGGAWGKAAAPLLRTVSFGFFFLLPLFIPPLFVLPHLFSWTSIKAGISPTVLVNKQPWLNQPAFIIRTVIYLGLLSTIILFSRRPSVTKTAGPMLVLTILLISLYSADWMMSLQPTFYSSLYPFMYFAGAMVVTFAIISGTMSWLQIKEIIPSQPELLHAFGKLLFASVLFWGYIMFAQFIIIWTGNLPDEAEWYLARSQPTWLWFTLFVLMCHFAIPFCILLSQDLKKNARQLLTVSLALIVMHFFEVFWMTRPTPGKGFSTSVFDLLTPLTMGACWLWFILGTPEASPFVESLQRRRNS